MFQENGLEFEASVVAQCDALISFIQQRKLELIEAITAEMNSKIQKVKEQMKSCDKKFQSVAGLLQYSNECLEEPDAASFLLVRTKTDEQIHLKNTSSCSVGSGGGPLLTGRGGIRRLPLSSGKTFSLHF